MRTISGALLMIAASICLGSAVIAERMPNPGVFRIDGVALLASMIFAPWGLLLLLVGVALDRQAESPPTPRWVWITLLVLLAAVIGLVALMLLAAPDHPH